MNHKLPILLTAALACVWVFLAGAQRSRADTPAAANPPDGQALIHQSARRLLEQTSLEAKIRQKIDMFGQQLVGTGLYWQLGQGYEKLLRLELKLQVAGQVTSLQQICDGRFLWVRMDMPEQKSLSRVDLRVLRDAVRKAGEDRVVEPANYWMALGGLPKLLSGLHENFRFSAAQSAKIGSVPVWVIHGRWKPEKLAELLPEQRDAILAGRRVSPDELPQRLPNHVVVTLGRDDLFPLFPYRIEYRRDGAGQGSVSADESGKSLLTIELFEVRHRADLDPRQFEYKPGDQAVLDQTQAYLQGLGLGEPPKHADR